MIASSHAARFAPLVRRRTPVLAGATLLVSFAFTMGVVMTVVFPTGREYAELSNERGADAYSIAYLTVLTRAEPNDTYLRLVYVRQLAELGRWDEALEVLEHAPASARRAAETRALRLDLLLAKARGIPDDTMERTAAFELVHAELGTLGDDVTAARARELARLALELGDPALAARFHLAAAEHSSPADRASSLADAARSLRAAGDGQRAAESYRRAADESVDPDQRAAYLVEAADTLEGSAGACAAATVLEPSASTSESIAFVRRAMELFRRCARAVDAKLAGRRVVVLSKGDAQEMKAQVRRELEAGDASGALVLLRTLVAARPDDATLREATARVAEWAGQPQVALRHWLWLFQTNRTLTGRVDLP